MPDERLRKRTAIGILPVLSLALALFASSAEGTLLGSSTATASPVGCARANGSSRAAGVSTLQAYQYDGHGNVSGFTDYGDEADPTDDLTASVTYDTGAAALSLYTVADPTHVEVHAGDALSGPLLRERDGVYDSLGNLKELRSQLDATGAQAAVELTYDPNGMLSTVQGPPNLKGERYLLSYQYDPIVGTYPTAITDSFGLTSSASYDLDFGEPLASTDVAGNRTSRTLDAFGRVSTVTGPYDVAGSPTIVHQYYPGASPAFAVTHNRLAQAQGAPGVVDTVVFVDGLRRVIQTKKTAEVDQGGAGVTVVGTSVSGRLDFDAMGRVSSQGQPIFDAGPESRFSFSAAARYPTLFSYDILGRTLATVEPNGATTRVAYGFATPLRGGYPRFVAQVTDPLNHPRLVYRDPEERIRAVEEHLSAPSPRALTTSYGYDPLGELTAIQDAQGDVTALGYDLLGRRTSLSQPDSGLTRFVFDPAGNLVSKQTADLAKTNQAIGYLYDYNRLTQIHHPVTGTDIFFKYGAPGAPFNGAGRVLEVDDEAGVEARQYGKLGELTETVRTVPPQRPGEGPESFGLAFSFDSFGRMLSMVYPDGELLTYGYDRGGLLNSAVGQRPAMAKEPAETEVYLQRLTYDEFGQRRYQRFGNGVTTAYSYEPDTRRLHTVATVTPQGRVLQAQLYGYDLVGNVLLVDNALGPPVGHYSGTTLQSFAYDDLYRLTSAQGSALSRPGVVDSYTAAFQYSDIHTMLENAQLHQITNTSSGEPVIDTPATSNHDWLYAYKGNGPHQATQIGQTHLTYDASGNTLAECDSPTDPTCQSDHDHLKAYAWDEESWLTQSVTGGGRYTRYLYDGSGQRVVKVGDHGPEIEVGQFFTLEGKIHATKHVFAGETRLASKLIETDVWKRQAGAGGNGGPGIANPGTSGGGSAGTTGGGNGNGKGGKGGSGGGSGNGPQNQNGCDPSNYQPQKCVFVAASNPVGSSAAGDADDLVRPVTYYYHPDHLGSTQWVTDQNALVHEHVEYYPYGQVWRDPKSDDDRGPTVQGQQFLFTSKQYDPETGNYYFGARYYDPKFARWISADPASVDAIQRDIDGLRSFLLKAPSAVASDETPSGAGLEWQWNAATAREVDEFPVHLSVYSFLNDNPILFIDRSGSLAGVDDAIEIGAGALFVAAGEAAFYAGLITGGVYCIGSHCLGDLNSLLGRPPVALMSKNQEGRAPTGNEALKPVGKASDKSNPAPERESATNARHTPDQEAVIELAQDAKKKGGMSQDEAKQLVEWAKEYGVKPARGPEAHPGRNFKGTHVHVGPVSHVPVLQ